MSHGPLPVASKVMAKTLFVLHPTVSGMWSSVALLCALRVAGIIVGVVMGHNRCSGVIKGVCSDRKGPMVSGTNCKVDYRVDEDLEAVR